MTEAELFSRLGALRRYTDAAGKAPHKPLLVLFALGRLHQGHDEVTYEQVQEALEALFARFSADRAKPAAHTPFCRLQNDGIWELNPPVPFQENGHSPPPAALFGVRGRFTRPVRDLLQSDPALINRAARHVLLVHLPQLDTAEVLEAVGLDGEPSPTTATTQYWTLKADPDVYRIAEAVRELKEDWWVTRGSGIKKGHWAAIWKTKSSDSWRGIVALAEVLSDPILRSDEGNKYWMKPPEGARPETRVLVRYHLLESPLMVDGPHEQLLRSLNVARARGGTVHSVTSGQWEMILDAVSDRVPPRVLADEYHASVAASLHFQGAVAELDKRRETLVRKEQGALRRLLFRGRQEARCLLCGKEYPVDLLVAAHVKRRADCSHEERLDVAHNVVPMCRFGCDELFERGYVAVRDGRIVDTGRVRSGAASAYIARLLERSPLDLSVRSQSYFDAHRQRLESSSAAVS